MNFNTIYDRKGTYCTQWDYTQDRFGEKDLLPFSISDTDFKVPTPIVNQLEAVLHHGIFGYTRWNHHDFKGAITAYFSHHYDCKIKEDWVFYSPSVMYSVSVLLRLLSKPNAVVGSFLPMYDAFFHVIEDNDRQLKVFPLLQQDGHFEIDEERFALDIQECDIFLLCSPHNPTGRVWSEEELTMIVSLCKQYDVKIISDEIHMDMVFQGHTQHSILTFYDRYQELYLVSSSSKTFNTPALIGSYACIPSVEVGAMFLSQLRHKDFLNSASVMGMHALMVGYQECDAYVEEMKSYVYDNLKYVKTYIEEHFSDIHFVLPEATYLAWIDVRELPFRDEEIQDALVHVGKVAVMSGITYGATGYLRLNCGCPREKLAEGMRRIKLAIDYLYQIK